MAAYDLVDACNGHFGTNPDSPAAEVYHYHVTDLAPFTTGCFGPALDANNAEVMVTVAMCRAAHTTVCDDEAPVDLATLDDAGQVRHFPVSHVGGTFLGGSNVGDRHFQPQFPPF